MENKVPLKDIADRMNMTVEQLEHFITDTPNRQRRMMDSYLNDPAVKEHLQKQHAIAKQKSLDKQNSNE